MNYCYYNSSYGQLLLQEQDHQLHRISFVIQQKPLCIPTNWVLNNKPFKELSEQLCLYFQRKLKSFAVQLFMQGTVFQQQVWQALQEIPYGQTMSYGGLAASIGRPNAARAVGAAANRNPFPIVIPCHRLVGSTGNLVGFAGGVKVKQALLELEGAR